MTPDDELLLSAVLDGEATDEEIARVSADPELRRQLAALRAAQAAMNPVHDPDPVRRDAAISAALDAMAPASRPGRTGTVVPLRRVAVVVGAAAAVVLVVVGLVAVLRGGSTTDATSTAVAASSGAASSVLPPSQAAAGAASPGSQGRLPAAAAVDLGTVDTADELVAALRQARTAVTDGTAGASPEVGSQAADAALSCPVPADTSFAAHAVLAGRPVLVFVTGPPDAPVAVVDDISCTPVLTRPL